MECLVNGDIAAGLGHIGGAGDAGRTGADDADPQAVRFDIGDVGPTALYGQIADPTLKAPDRHRFEGSADRADAFALVFLGADAATDRRQQIGIAEHVIGLSIVLVDNFLNKTWNINRHRAAANTGGIRAHQASLALEQGILEPITERDLREICDARLGFL